MKDSMLAHSVTTENLRTNLPKSDHWSFVIYKLIPNAEKKSKGDIEKLEKEVSIGLRRFLESYVKRINDELIVALATGGLEDVQWLALAAGVIAYARSEKKEKEDEKSK